MKSTDIVELSGNDGWQFAVRKINENFKRLYSCLINDTTIKTNVVGDSLRQEIADAEARLHQIVEDAKDELEEVIEATEKRFDQEIKNVRDATIPPVGTYIYATYNPNEKWTTTTWERVGEGKFLISAGTTYKEGSEYGSNEVTLSVNQIPSHTHNGPSHTHTGPSHTHTGPSHTHSIDDHTHQNTNTVIEWSNTHEGNLGFIEGTDAGAGSYKKKTTTDSGGSGTTGASGTGSTGAAGTGATGASGTGATSATGGGQAHTNIPKSIAVPLWKRTK